MDFYKCFLQKTQVKIFSMQTPLREYTSTRRLQGGCDYGKQFQAMTQRVLENSVEKFAQWIDDFLLCASSEEELNQSVGNFLELCKGHGMKVNPSKYQLFSRRVDCCGPMSSMEGCSMNQGI